MNTYTLKIIEIRRETEDTKTFCFKQPALRKIKYEPGQYLTLLLTINNRKYHRPYSFSSSPGIDPTLNITVKRVPKGIVSNHLIDMVKEGDIIEVMEPMGDFIYRDSSDDIIDIFLWGAGSGITPLMSILKTALNGIARKVILSYSNSTKAHTIFYKELQRLKIEYGDRFSLNFFFTKETCEDTVFGRISNEHVKAQISGYETTSIHYICGPQGLKETMQKILIYHGLPLERIYFEDFEHIVNEDQLKEITTRTVKIINNDIANYIEVVKGKSILEAVLDYNIDIAYSCQTGTCTLCKALLLSGKVKVIKHNKLSTEIEENEFLLCSTYPLSDDVNFKIISI